MGFFFYALVYNIYEMKDTTPIDFVIPYVNNNDLVWRKIYVDYCSKNNAQKKIVEMLGSRFGGITFIYDQLYLVNKNMPWINKIYLLLSNKEQIIPSLLPPNCEIVLHKDFIPPQFLPTFNSTTIEMFLWNIKGLSEKFIYANDDMLPIQPLKPTDFYYGNKIRIGWREDKFLEGLNVYGYQCHNNCVALSYRLKANYPKDMILKPVHSFTPMFKSHCKDAFFLIKDFILPHIRGFRTQYQYNQYIYPLYEHLKYGTLPSKIDFLYTELDKDVDFNHQIICVNMEKDNTYIKKYKEFIRELCK